MLGCGKCAAFFQQDLPAVPIIQGIGGHHAGHRHQQPVAVAVVAEAGQQSVHLGLQQVTGLGQRLGIDKLSAHDCRHYCATKMARLGYSVDELMAWFGWTSAQTAMRYVADVEVKERYKG